MKKALSIILSLVAAFLAGNAAIATSQASSLGDVPYTVSYSFIGASGNINPTSTTGSEDYAIITLTESTPHMDGHIFAGWSLLDDNTPNYSAGDTITITAQETTLYATWTPNQILLTTDESPIESTNDIELPTSSGAVQPLGRSSVSSSSQTAPYSFWASLIIAIGTIFSITIVLGAIYYMFVPKKS